MRAYFDDIDKFSNLSKSNIDNNQVERITFETELCKLLNYYSVENQSNTPDFILVNYIKNCLDNFSKTIKQRDNWYNFNPTITNEINN